MQTAQAPIDCTGAAMLCPKSLDYRCMSLPHFLLISNGLLLFSGTALGFQIDGAAIFYLGPRTLPELKFLQPRGIVKMVDTISLKINGAFAPCAPL